MNVARFAVLLAVVQIAAAGAASAIDLTGKWRVEYNASNVEFVDVVQSGAILTATLAPYPVLPLATTGTFSEPTLSFTLQTPGCTPPACYGNVEAIVLPNGNWFIGRLQVGFSSFPDTLRALGSRCECFDGNLTDGDGCDARCRIEPCFDCAGMPSVCTPTADGGACRDASDCTSGETCAAGVCGGGVTTASCIDLNGLWDVHGESSLGVISDWLQRIEQRDGVVRFVDVPSGITGSVGTIDLVTGALDLPNPRLHILCPPGFIHTLGTAAADGLTFEATGSAAVVTPFMCQEFAFSLEGTRRICGDGELGSGEVCDDGNLTSGDGCDANCRPTGCGNGVVTAGEECDDGNVAAGDGCSATCTNEVCGDGLPEGSEVCDDGNLVSGDGCDANCRPTGCGNGLVFGGEQCDDGNLAPGDGCSATCAIDPCWTCSGGQPSVCTTAYQSSCASALRPRSARLRLRQAAKPARDSIAARSSETGPMPTANLGNPLATTAYQVCLFDRSGATPQLLLGASVPAGGTCGGEPCWRAEPGGFSYRNRAAVPHGILKLQVAGGASDGRALVVARGAGLDATATGFPPLPLPAPLELQIQNVENGAGCFAIEIPAAGVTRNDPAAGRFIGHGMP